MKYLLIPFAAIALTGCAYLHSSTTAPDGAKTAVSIYTLFDANSQMTKFANRAGTNNGSFVSGLNDSSSSTNLNALAASLLQAVATGLVQGVK